MSMLKAAGLTVTTTLNAVTTTVKQVNKLALAADLSTDLLLSNTTLWAKRGINRNNDLIENLEIESQYATAQALAEKTAAHRTWLAQDPSREADFNAALELLKARREAKSNNPTT